jgi:peptidoglycan/xylan/chitin deacetylase (PgdA/CDA1 family)
MSDHYKLPILMYHSVIKNKSERGKHNIYVTVDKIRKQLYYLKSKNYETITFRDIHEGKIKDFNKKIILTFDDGYEDNYDLLFPILKELNYTAVIYLVTRLEYNVWGTKEGEPRRNLMSKAQILEMDAYGVEFGGHTCHHLALDHISSEEAKFELEHSKSDIEQIINQPVISFAYPFGEKSENIKKLTAAAGYKYGISTKSGPINFQEDLMEIRRIEIAYKTPFFVFKRKVSGNYLTKKFFSF